ncbi:hypothetical protein Tco_1095216 [Tanacetum coccineum]
MMKRQKGVGQSSSKKGKTTADLTNFESFANAYKPRQEQEEDQHDAFSRKHDNLFKQPGEKKTIELPKQSWFNELLDADKDLREHELQIGSTVMFAKQMKSFLNKDTITKAYLEEGDRFHTDLSKPLPLEGPPGRKTTPTRYFFNKYLEYLMHGNEEKKYDLSLSKIKAARYEQEGIEEMIPHL